MTYPPQLDDTERTVSVPSTRWWRRLLAFVGPAYMVSVGYMDPGNWATDIAGGSQFGYTLLWVLVLASLTAILLQTLSARLGLVTGHDLAQACRDEYPPAVRYVLFVLTEIAIVATDLAEALGSAIGLNLLTGIPVLWAVVITAGDVLLLLVIQRFGIRKMEGVIVALISVIGACFLVEIFLSRPEWGGVLRGLRPAPMSPEQLYIAIGILGATVMPHNLYLHSSLVQSRDVARTRGGVAQACRYNLVDSTVALGGAMLVNAAILIVAAAAFWRRGIEVTELQQAHGLLEGLLGSSLAPIAFAVALIAAGQSSTVTGTLAGQITMEGFLRFRMRPWLRRLATRLVAVVPAVAVIAAVGEGGVYRLLILSQVILSLQLPFAVVPLIRFTSSRRKMGPFTSPGWLRALAWLAAAAIVGLNGWLLYYQLAEWTAAAGPYGTALAAAGIAVAAGLGGLLLWLALRRETAAQEKAPVSAERIVAAAKKAPKPFRRIGVALEARPTDADILAEAIDLAAAHHAELVLMHVVEGVGGQWYGPQTGDLEGRADEEYLAAVAERLRTELAGRTVAGVRYVVGYGDVPRAIIRLVREQGVDFLVMGGHGHRRLGDLLHGETIQRVRHGLEIPVLAIRERT
ncbi:MAG: Nramp family divalent metal transporter [Planctomycetota bacterium]|nr:Nramp family divalent metal transporter [Planctomycetota bacterium]